MVFFPQHPCAVPAHCQKVSMNRKYVFALGLSSQKANVRKEDIYVLLPSPDSSKILLFPKSFPKIKLWLPMERVSVSGFSPLFFRSKAHVSHHMTTKSSVSSGTWCEFAVGSEKIQNVPKRSLCLLKATSSHNMLRRWEVFEENTTRQYYVLKTMIQRIDGEASLSGSKGKAKERCSGATH